MTEADFQAQVIDIARWNRWRVYHTHDSRHSPAGFPDLVLAQTGRLIFAELKTDQGRATKEQLAWLATLQSVEVATDGTVQAHLWRPRDLEDISQALQRIRRP